MQFQQVIERDDIKIVVNREACIGAATCAVYAANTFDIDEESKAIIKEGQWDVFEKIVAAAESCPVLAIEVYKAGQKIYPKPSEVN